MPTVLLQEIRDLLTAFLTAINQKIEAILTSLQNVEDDVDEIKDDVDQIADDVAVIKENSNSLPVIEQHTTSIDNKLTQTNIKLDAANGYLSDIKDNTGAIVTPVNKIKQNTDTLVSNSNSITDDVHDLSNYAAEIADHTGAAAAFDEDTATNTLNIYNKVVTIASDTTQMRADNQVIIAILNQIYDKL